MLLTIDKLNINFNEDINEMRMKLAELKRLNEAIENSAHYKLLAGKTQMIGKGKGVTKKERSRYIHTNNIAHLVVKRSVEKIYDRILEEIPDLASGEYEEIFELNKEIDIQRGIIMAKAHDIGHVAWGHEGEKAINEFMSQIKNPMEIQAILNQNKKYFGEEYERNQGHITDDNSFEFRVQSLSFEHNELSAIIFNEIVEKENINLTPEEIRKLTLGILGHSTSRTPISLLENDVIAQLVRVADKVEYINADYDEICSLLCVDLSTEDKILEYFQKTFPERLEQTTNDLAEEVFRTGEINEGHFTMRRLRRARKSYEDIIYVYDGSYAKSILKDLLQIADDQDALQEYYSKHKGVEVLYPPNVVKQIREDYETMRTISQKQHMTEEDVLIFDDAYQRILTEKVHFKGAFQGENPERIYFMYQRILNYYYNKPEMIPTGMLSSKVNPIDIKKSAEFEYELNPEQTNLQRLREYISLLDDKSLEEEYDRLVNERIDKGHGFGIEPITMEEIKLYLRRKLDEEAQKRIVQSNMGTRSYEEARALCSQEGKRYYEEFLTDEGKNAVKKAYEIRLAEHFKDYIYLQKMYEADEKRTALITGRTIMSPAQPELRDDNVPVELTIEDGCRPVATRLTQCITDFLHKKHARSRFFPRDRRPKDKDERAN